MMKRFAAIIGSLILAVVLAVGGFKLGEWNQRQKNKAAEQNQAASPKQSGVIGAPAESAKPEENDIPVQPVPEGGADRAISKLDISAVSEGEWTRVSSNSIPNEDGNIISLYTSAEKDDNGYLWDDSQKWVVEMEDGNDGYYTLYDQNVANGRVYMDVSGRDNGDLIVTVYTLSSAGTSVMQYNRTDSGFTEKQVYNSGAVNRLFTSIPDYE